MAKRRRALNRLLSSSSDDDDDEEEEIVEEETSDDNDDEEEDSDDSSSEGYENDDESSKRQTLMKLLEPFGKDQIIDLLEEAALKDPSLLKRIHRKAESDPTNRKIFIHGLDWDTTEGQLLQVFKPFGEIEELKLITDKVTGRAKGYAFVLFKTLSAVKEALKVPQKRIGNRVTSCQLASVGRSSSSTAGTGNNASAASADVNVSQRKLFVANVSQTVNVDRLRAFFAKFGEIEDGPMGLDPATNKPRGFAIFAYKSVDGVKRALEEPVKLFEGCQLNCKKFIEGLHNRTSTNNAVSNNTINSNSNVNYGFGLNVGEILGSNLSGGGMLMQQNPGIGLIGNPMWAAALNQTGLPGLGAGLAAMGGNYGINSINPGMVGSYGMGAYNHSAYMGQPFWGATAAGGTTVGTGSTRNHSTSSSSGMSLPTNFSS